MIENLVHNERMKNNMMEATNLETQTIKNCYAFVILLFFVVPIKSIIVLSRLKFFQRFSPASELIYSTIGISSAPCLGLDDRIAIDNLYYFFYIYF